jgi:SAM-dependent methyltransferase
MSAVAAVSDTAVAEPSLRAAFDRIGYVPETPWAWDGYKASIIALSQEYGLKRHLEIGGGRDPLFTPEEAAAHGLDMTINDISPVELERTSAHFRTACFDVSGDISASGIAPGSIDMAYSRMVFEHVKDVRRAWRNLHTLLAPGGVAIAFHPTLYAAPFVANMLIPESLSSKIVSLLYKNRTADEDPKFPAHYDWCYGDAKIVEPMLSAIGFRDVAVLPFYGHDYFQKLPVVRQIDDWVSRTARRKDFARLSAYAYTVVRK